MIEEKLRELIIERYGSVNAFSTATGIPNSTIMSILKRGVSKASISNMIKICNALDISTDELAQGRITPVVKESKKIDLTDLITYNDYLTVDGEKLTSFDKKLILQVVEMIRMARKEMQDDE